MTEEKKCTCHLPPPTPKKVPRTASNRAALNFPVGRIHGIIKRKVTPARVSKTSTVYTTASLEYVISELMIQAIQECKNLKRYRLTRYHLARTIQSNPAFANVFKMASPEAFPEHKKASKRKLITNTSQITNKKSKKTKGKKSIKPKVVETLSLIEGETVQKSKKKVKKGKSKKKGHSQYDLMSTYPTYENGLSLSSYNPPRPVAVDIPGIELLLKDHPL